MAESMAMARRGATRRTTCQPGIDIQLAADRMPPLRLADPDGLAVPIGVGSGSGGAHPDGR